MEVKRLNSVPFAMERIVCSVITESLMVETAMAAQKALVSLLFLIGSLPKEADVFSNVLDTEKRFPFGDLTRVSRPGPENKDASETEDDDDDDEDEDASDGDDNDENGDDSGEEGSDDDDDDEADPDDDSEANGNGESDDDDDDDNEEDDDEDDDDEEEEDEDELARPPSKKKK